MSARLLKRSKKDARGSPSMRSSGTVDHLLARKITEEDVSELTAQVRHFCEMIADASKDRNLPALLRAIGFVHVPPQQSRGFQDESVREQYYEAEKEWIEACHEFSVLANDLQQALHCRLCVSCSGRAEKSPTIVSAGEDASIVSGWKKGVPDHRLECSGILKDWCYTLHGVLMEHYTPGLSQWCDRQRKILEEDIPTVRTDHSAFCEDYSQLEWQEKPLKVIIPEEINARLMAVLKHFLCRSSAYLDTDRVSLKTTTDLLAFVQYYSVDRLSCLVGFQPSKGVIDAAVTAKIENSGLCSFGFGSLVLVKDIDGEAMRASQHGLASSMKLSQGADDCGSRLSNKKLAIGRSTSGSSHSSIYNDELSRARRRKSKTEALRERSEQDEEPSTLDRPSLSLPEQSVTIKLANVRWRFGRSLGYVGGKVEVLTGSDQQRTALVDEKFCYALPEFLQEQVISLSETDPSQLEQFIANPVNFLSRTLLQLVQDLTFDFFAETGIDIEAIRRAHRSQALLGDTFELQKARDALSGIQDQGTLPAKLLVDVQAEAMREIRAFCASRGPHGIFAPTFRRDLDQLQELYSTRSVLVACSRLKNNVDSSLEQLKFKKFQLLKGQLKKELVAWWLKLISSSVKKFIAEWGFISSAVPKDYTEVPPSDFNHVRRNMDLLASLLLNTGKYKSQMEGHIRRLQNTIYPRINAFIRDTKAVISAELHVDISQMPLEEVKILSDELTAGMNDQMTEWIRSTVMDIIYLQEMRLLDDPEYSKGKTCLDIVPVSGLVMSVLLRIENEHKTVLDLWGHLDGADCLVESLAIHRAIGDKNERLAERLLEEGVKRTYFNINEQDQNGWTALHCAASNQFYKLCRKLVAAGANPDITNQDNSTALIYIVKRRDSEITDSIVKKERVKALKALLSAGAASHLSNKLGESPLHLACLRGHVDLARILLQHSAANVNEVTKKHETALHYAVRVRSPELILELLAHGADLSVQSIDGETPLDRALESGDKSIIEALRRSHVYKKARKK